MVVAIGNWPIKSLRSLTLHFFAFVTNSNIKSFILLISINLALYATPNLCPARRCRTISNEKPNNEAQELSENDSKFPNVKTYLHITVMLKTLSKDLKRFPQVVQTIFVLSTSGFLHRIVPKNTYILGSETVFNCYLQGPSIFALQFGFCFREWGNDCPTAVVEKIIFQPPFWKGSDLILSVFCLWKIHRTITLYFYVQRVWVS